MALKDGFESRTVEVALAPEMLSAVVREHGRVLACSEIRIEPGCREGHWQAGLDAFQAWIRHAGVGLRAVPLTISVSTRWCRLAMLPWSDALLYQDSAQRYQQERFMQIYGSAARGWEVLCDDSPRGQTRLACAIDSDFTQALRAAAQAYGHQNVRLESVVTASGRTIAAAPCDRFAILEPGRLVLVASKRPAARESGRPRCRRPGSNGCCVRPKWARWRR
jgi:hypothetical protein